MKRSTTWLALIGLSLSSFIGCIDLTIVNTALPAIQHSLNASVDALQWVINILLLTLSAVMVVLGRLADLHGRRKMLYMGMALFAISSLVAGLAPSITWLLVGRSLQGIAVAILYAMPVAMIPSLFPLKQQGKATGILIGANGFGLAFGLVAGGLILSVLSWRWIFLINPPLILLSFLFCMTTIPESKTNDLNRQIDWLGLILLIIALPLLVLAIIQGSEWGWLSFKTLGTAGIAIIGLIVFYLHEQRHPSPIIQFHFFSHRLFGVGMISNVMLAAFYAVTFFLVPLYMSNVLHQSEAVIGLTMLPGMLLVAILSPVVGMIVDKVGAPTVLLIGLALLIVCAGLQVTFSSTTPLWFVVLAMIFLGLGWGFLLGPALVLALSTVPKESSGVGIGTLGTMHNLGGSIGLAVGTVVFHTYHYAGAMAFLMVLSVIAFMGTWVGRK